MIILRKATTRDCKFLYDLHTDSTVRKFSQQPDPFTMKQHKEWLAEILQQPEQHVYVAMRNGHRVGSGRLSHTGIGFQLSDAGWEKHRGKKVGKGVVEQLVLEARALDGGVESIILHASVRADNIASIRSVLASGFTVNDNPAWLHFTKYC